MAKRFDGTNQVEIANYKRFDGTNWVNCIGKRFDGTNWVDVTFTLKPITVNYRAGTIAENRAWILEIDVSPNPEAETEIRITKTINSVTSLELDWRLWQPSDYNPGYNTGDNAMSYPNVAYHIYYRARGQEAGTTLFIGNAG